MDSSKLAGAGGKGDAINDETEASDRDLSAPLRDDGVSVGGAGLVSNV